MTDQQSIAEKFSDECMLLAGRLEPLSTKQSILFYTVAKSASVYVGKILKQLAVASGMTPIDWEQYCWEQGSRFWELFASQADATNAFKKTGFMFGPYRSLNFPLEALNSYRVLLLLRDPRDVLVSLYFSMAYSHGMQNEAIRNVILPKRRRALS
ncbi:MAG: hypothetical protein Q8R76_10605 [Candidatus Omnitrophota bacterium]|nr:hypothetical protein [Candidatus Omnitrophota bacterium]